jgi:peptide chain release factor 3
MSVYELDDPAVVEHIGETAYEDLVMSVELLDEAGDDWSLEDFLAGDVTPFFFGSAMSNFGIGQLLDGLRDLAPPPKPRPTIKGERAPDDDEFSGFIFKIQANMNPRHRDRIAFMRVVSGQFERGMAVRVARTGKTMKLSKPHSFMASERAIVEDAQPGDIVGLFDPGELRIGDTLYLGKDVKFQGIPRFAPTLFTRVILKDPTRRKHLQNGLRQLAQEGTVQLFFREGLGAADPYLGAVGQLQFEVLKERLRNEYKVKVQLESAPFRVARWVQGSEESLAWLKRRQDYLVVTDRDGRPVVLAQTPWALAYATQECKDLSLLDVSPLDVQD